MSRRKLRNYEHEDDMRSEILGVGSYQFMQTSAGKTKMKSPIGFVRQAAVVKKPVVQRKLRVKSK